MISVIIPCYNHGKYLGEALESVIAQTYQDWECVIVDDGSVDNTQEVANFYTKGHANIKYLQKKNGGLSSARNAGLDHVKGAWIQFLDADDILETRKFERQLGTSDDLKSNNNIISYTDYRYGIDADIRKETLEHLNPAFTTKDFLGELITRWETSLIIPPHCFLFSSHFFLKDGIRFDESLPNHEDFDCWLRIFFKTSFDIIC